MKPLAHLTIRVAWHDSQWNGSVCAQPGLNSFCAALPRIRESKRPEGEKLAGRSFEGLCPGELPPCKAESGFCMNKRPWVREFDHPYRENQKCADMHGNMKKRRLSIPAGSAVAVPFNWMRRRNQKQIEQRSPQALPTDIAPPFPSTWVFGRKRQEALLDSRAEKSDACRRNTNLFGGIMRERSGEPPHAENLIHKTEKGHMVRSKSELVIANLLYREGITYDYEQLLDGEKVLGRLHPDFSFADAAGDRVIWEHLGMMDDA